MERLTELYWQLVQEEGPLELEEFLEQVASGKHGAFAPQEIARFLDETYRTMIANIELKASEAPDYESMREEIVAHTEERIQRLKERYAASK